MKKYKKSDARKAFIEMDKADITVTKVANECGIGNTTAIAWLKDAGLYAMKNRQPLSSQEKVGIVEAYIDGQPLSLISSRFGISASTVSKLAKKEGVIRSQSEAQSIRATREKTGGYRGDSGAFHSMKVKKWIVFSSRYEYARMVQLDNDDSVIWWDRCSDRIPYRFNGDRHYNPDIHIIYTDGMVAVEEIKPKSHVNNHMNIAKFDAARDYYRDRGVAFRVVTEDEIGKKFIYSLEATVISGLTPAEKDERRKMALAKYNETRTPEQIYERKVRNREARKARVDRMRGTQEWSAWKSARNAAARESYAKKRSA